MPTADNHLPTGVVTSLLVFVLILFVIKMKQVKQCKITGQFGLIFVNKVTGVPSVSLFMLLKSSLKFRFDAKKAIQHLLKIYGEMFQLNYFGIPNIVFTSNPSILQKIFMSTDMGHLHKPNVYSKTMNGPLKDVLVSSSPEMWKIRRGVFSKAYAYKGLLRQLNIFEEHAKKFVLTLQESNPSSSLEKPNIPFPKQVQKLTFDIILHIAAGKVSQEDCQNEDQTRFQNNFDRWKELVSYRLSHPVFVPNVFWYLSPRKWEMEKLLEEISEYCYKFVKVVRNQFDSDEKNGINMDDDDMGGRSLVEVMIKGGLSNDEIVSQIVAFFLAGREAISNSLCIMLFLLARHQNYQIKCQREIDLMFNQMNVKNLNELSMEALKSLTCLDMCIKESSRLYTIFPLYGRSLTSTMKIDDNILLPKGTWVIAHTEAIHRNPKIYPEPDKFIPERFAPENKRKFGPCEYMPFSAGIRNCIAYKSAMIQLKVMAAYVLRNFDVSSDMTMNELECLVKETTWPSFPELDIKIRLRQYLY